MLTLFEHDAIRTGNAKINKRHMAVRVRYPVIVHIRGRRQRLDTGMFDFWRWGQDLYAQSAFFPNLTVKRFFGIFIQLDMSSDRKPLVIFFMIHKQNPTAKDNENGNNKIVKLVDVRQGKRTKLF